MALDKIHNAVKNALIKDGWEITADPYRIEYEEYRLYADLSAERPIAAVRENEKIVVEIKSFLNRSSVNDFENAVGQYIVYKRLLSQIEPETKSIWQSAKRLIRIFSHLRRHSLLLKPNKFLFSR